MVRKSAASGFDRMDDDRENIAINMSPSSSSPAVDRNVGVMPIKRSAPTSNGAENVVSLLDRKKPWLTSIRRFGMVAKLTSYLSDPFHTLLNLPCEFTPNRRLHGGARKLGGSLRLE